MTSVFLPSSRPNSDEADPVCGPCSGRHHDAHSPEYLDLGGVEQVCGCLCAQPLDDELYDFLEVHETGPCPGCPIDAHVAELLR